VHEQLTQHLLAQEKQQLFSNQLHDRVCQPPTSMPGHPEKPMGYLRQLPGWVLVESMFHRPQL
jgi:hypothetical protein